LKIHFPISFTTFGITTDGTNLYVAGSSNHKIPQIVIATGAVTTLAGPPQGNTSSGDIEGTGSAAGFNTPREITTDGTNVYVGEQVITKIKKL
jgi:hypothetical protein